MWLGDTVSLLCSGGTGRPPARRATPWFGLLCGLCLSWAVPLEALAQGSQQLRGEQANDQRRAPPVEGAAAGGVDVEAAADERASSGPDGPDAELAQPEAEEAEEAEEADGGSFTFGSYGRVGVGSDLRGALGRDADIVAFAPRIDEDVYAELELARIDQIGDVTSHIVATLAIVGPLFHLDAEFEDAIAVRNLYAEGQNLLPGLSAWAGSRMVRGDDIYLLNWWPLDNLNLLGGGLRYELEDRVELRFHGGLSRPKDPFQLQRTRIVPRFGFEPEEVAILDRPRTTLAARATLFPFGYRDRDWAWKVVLYGEAHFLPEGERRLDTGLMQNLPSDQGFMVGGQIGLWTGDRTFAHLFVRYAQGLAAYDPFSVPFRTTENVVSTTSTSEFLVALSANYEHELFGIQGGAYFRRFDGVDERLLEGGLLTEAAINVRPHWYITDVFGLAADLSWQNLQLAAVDDRTGELVGGNAFKFGLIPYVSLGGRGTFARPHLRLIYSATVRDDGGMALIAPDAPFADRRVEHFLGVGAEWWFNSTSYR